MERQPRRMIRLAIAFAAAALVGAPALAGACTSDPECDDGLACNGVETCNLGTMQCQPGTPVVCPPPTQCQLSNDCQEPTGECVPTNQFDNVLCDDGFHCTIGDTCQGGVCVGGPGADSDNDGDCDLDEADCGCNPNDDREVCHLPNRLIGQIGSGAGEVLLEWHTPTLRKVPVATDEACDNVGRCTDGFCTRGRIRDVCTTDGDCALPADTCRVIINFGDQPDINLVFARIGRLDQPGFTPAVPGCSRKIDVTLDPIRPVTKLRVKAEGTVDGRRRRDRDVIRFHR